MFWVIAASVLVGVMLGASLGILVMRLAVAPDRASEAVRIRDQT